MTSLMFIGACVLAFGIWLFTGFVESRDNPEAWYGGAIAISAAIALSGTIYLMLQNSA
jgi:hypothetical protein